MAGNIRIIEPKSNYQKVSKAIIYDKGVDPLTLGIYVKVLCMGKDWNLNVKGLSTILKVSADKIRASFRLLEEVGFLRRERVKDESGKFSGWDYEISSEPFTDMAKIPTSVKTDIGENRISGNDTLYRDNNVDRDSNSKKKIINLRQGLLDMGVTPDHINDWFKVRREKKRINTQTAAELVISQIRKAASLGLSPDDCIRIAAANSWGGFMVRYLNKDILADEALLKEETEKMPTQKITAEQYYSTRQ